MLYLFTITQCWTVFCVGFLYVVLMYRPNVSFICFLVCCTSVQILCIGLGVSFVWFWMYVEVIYSYFVLDQLCLFVCF